MIIALTLSSCSTEEDDINVGEPQNKAPDKTLNKMLLEKGNTSNRITCEHSEIIVRDFGFQNSMLNAVEESDCGPTPLRDVFFIMIIYSGIVG